MCRRLRICPAGLTSDIVNVGIQQGGIEDEVPRQIATEEMEKLFLFVSEDDQQTVMDAYTEDNILIKKKFMS